LTIFHRQQAGDSGHGRQKNRPNDRRPPTGR